MIPAILKKYIFSGFFLFLAGSYPAYAETYQIEFKTFDACGVYEATCIVEKETCFSTLSLPIEKNGKYGRLNAEISIKNKFVDLEFKAEEQELSISANGWESFSGRLEDFFLEPQIIKLYYPNPAIMHDGENTIPLVVRPPNAFVTGVLVDIQPVSASE